ncbi:ankyrin repeat domain-containing protein [Saccharicrinis aurantiacus]|uniref:ankyrin repeat domain-containing protein n=1 Tax=Saccharicrinis aurantiacus TaxID=1849719 RepID=UPI002492BC16|nr:ankyrin repeat domain-containing protein [Saccharicrinis aurantiacus]
MNKYLLLTSLLLSSLNLFSQHQQELFNQYVNAINSGDTKEVLHILELGLNPNYDTKNSTINTYEYVLHKGYMVYRSTVEASSSYPPLFFAIMARNTKVIEALLKLGAKADGVYSANKFGLIHYFVESEHYNKSVINPSYLGREETVDLLIKGGADLNLQGSLKVTPLHLATQHNNFELVKLLLNRGADIMVVDNDGTNAFYRAVSGNCIDIVNYLIQFGYDINEANNQGVTPLHYALELGHIDIAKLLLRNGSILSKDNKGATELHYATLGGSSEMIRYFINEKGFNANIADNNGRSALHYIYEVYWTDKLDLLISTLIDNNGDINKQDSDGNTPLMLVILNDKQYVLPSLLKYKPDLELANSAGSLPLHEAFKCYDTSIARLLIDAGVNINSRDTRNNTPLHVIAGSRRENKSIFIDELINKGADVNAINIDGETPLFTAIKKHKLNRAELLVNNGAKINAVNKYGRSPLHLACELGNLAAVKFLTA